MEYRKPIVGLGIEGVAGGDGAGGSVSVSVHRKYAGAGLEDWVQIIYRIHGKPELTRENTRGKAFPLVQASYPL